MGSFAEFVAASAGAPTLAQLAAALGVDPLLLVNVDLGRQALPADVAEAAAEVLGSTFYEVVAAAAKWTPQTGPTARRPLPPDPLVQALPSVSLAPTVGQPVPTSTAQYPRQLWTAGHGVRGSGDAASVNGAMAFGRDASPKFVQFSHVAYSTFDETAALAFDGTDVWTFGSASAGGYYGARVATTPPTLAVEGTDPSFARPSDAAYEPKTRRVWVANNANPTIARFNPDLSQAAEVTLAATSTAYGLQEYVPFALVAVGGKLYVTAWYDPGGGLPPDGRLFEVDAETEAILRVSAGANMGAPWGVAYDEARRVFYVANNFWPYTGGQFSAGLWVVDRATLTATALPLDLPVECPPLQGARWVAYHYGRVWVSGYDSTLYAVDPESGEVLRWRQFAGPTFTGLYAGRVVADPPAALYAADPWTGGVHFLHPDRIESTALFLDASAGGGGAEPIAVLVVDPGVPPALVP